MCAAQVRPEHREHMVQSTPTILEFCAERRREEEEIASKYLGSTPRSARKAEAVKLGPHTKPTCSTYLPWGKVGGEWLSFLILSVGQQSHFLLDRSDLPITYAEWL